MRSGVRLGIDVGKARIGVARTDLHGMLATPVETVARDAEGSTDIARILAIAEDIGAVEFVVGLPLNMSGNRTPSTEDAESFAQRIATAVAASEVFAAFVEVRLIDERLSTVSAHGQLRQAGKKTKQTKHIIDQAAAVIILQQALDMERARGGAPGTVVAPLVSSTDSATADPDS